MALPTRCGECTFFATEGSRCLRHAPGTAFEEFERIFWPAVLSEDRCGSGEKVGNGKEGPVSCAFCIFWHQPGGLPLKPDYRQGMSEDWWKDTGFCVRFAPSPSGEEGRIMYHYVTHATDCCGDGEEVHRDEDY